jgi:hypothetical protein
VGDTGSSGDRTISLRYAGNCTDCGESIPQGTRAIYRPSAKSVRHIDCTGMDPGEAGASAMREYERRKARDEIAVEAQRDDIRERFGQGFLGRVAMYLAVDDRPRQSTTAWKQGAVGEQIVAMHLDALAEFGVVVLHDRRIPGTRANIDHIAVTPWGVWVIDPKRYLNKRVTFDIVGGFFGFGGRGRLIVGGRNESRLLDGLEKQVALVRQRVGPEVEVSGCLCFVEADWPLIGGDFSIRGLKVCWPRRLPKTLLRTTPAVLDPGVVAPLLARAFPPA